MDKQALQRAHRIGQINHVLSINLVTGRTIEEVRLDISSCTYNYYMLMRNDAGYYAQSKKEVTTQP